MGWALGIVGVIVLSVLVDIVLPEGQMNKYIKGIFAVLLIYMLISPVVALVKKDISLDDILDFGASGYEENTAYIQSINTDRLDIAKEQIAAMLENKGISGANIVIFSAANNINLVDYVVVELYNGLCGLDEGAIKNIVRSYLAVTEENIRIISFEA